MIVKIIIEYTCCWTVIVLPKIALLIDFVEGCPSKNKFSSEDENWTDDLGLVGTIYSHYRSASTKMLKPFISGAISPILLAWLWHPQRWWQNSRLFFFQQKYEEWVTEPWVFSLIFCKHQTQRLWGDFFFFLFFLVYVLGWGRGCVCCTRWFYVMIY